MLTSRYNYLIIQQWKSIRQKPVCFWLNQNLRITCIGLVVLLVSGKLKKIENEENNILMCKIIEDEMH